jgi:hypothetical protein
MRPSPPCREAGLRWAGACLEQVRFRHRPPLHLRLQLLQRARHHLRRRSPQPRAPDPAPPSTPAPNARGAPAARGPASPAGRSSRNRAPPRGPRRAPPPPRLRLRPRSAPAPLPARRRGTCGCRGAAQQLSPAWPSSSSGVPAALPPERWLAAPSTPAAPRGGDARNAENSTAARAAGAAGTPNTAGCARCVAAMSCAS